MPNQIDPDRKRAVFILDKDDYETLETYAARCGFTPSIMLREATFRLANEIREKGRVLLTQTPKDNEGAATTKSSEKIQKGAKRRNR
jgi:hypothetical protein